MPINLKAATRFTIVAATLASFAVLSADHAESPGADADPAADLADVFLFPSPESSSRLVGAVTFGGRAAPRSRIDGSFYCDSAVLYTFNIDRADATGAFDNVPDIKVHARLARNIAGQCGVQLENVPGAGGTFAGPVEQVFSSGNGIKAFAGLRNDPFFFDAEGLTALLATFAAPGQNGNLASAFRLAPAGQARRDSFGGRNVSAIVFEMDLNAVIPAAANGTRPQVRIWATTGRLAS